MDTPIYTPPENPLFNMARYCIAASAAATPGKPALIVVASPDATPSEIWTYADLEDAVLRTAGALRALGLTPGDRIMIRLDNTSAYAILFFGAIATDMGFWIDALSAGPPSPENPGLPVPANVEIVPVRASTRRIT